MLDIPFSTRQRRRTSGTDVSVAVSLAVLQILIAVILTLISLMEQFNVDACGFSRHCDFDLLTRSVFVTPLAAVGALLIEGVAVALLVRRGSRIWWVPAVGIVVVIVGYVVAHVLNAVATGVA
ncbi:hypothetical protein RCH16_003526 [Cryobacterium sp. MP_M5]|nr:hypothetical protein [Cryobacterium sp. MP_M3]MEC5178487.1 hypothetical protein [Cryobacterium sp. MP_M5]